MRVPRRGIDAYDATNAKTILDVSYGSARYRAVAAARWTGLDVAPRRPGPIGDRGLDLGCRGVLARGDRAVRRVSHSRHGRTLRRHPDHCVALLRYCDRATPGLRNPYRRGPRHAGAGRLLPRRPALRKATGHFSSPWRG